MQDTLNGPHATGATSTPNSASADVPRVDLRDWFAGQALAMAGVIMTGVRAAPDDSESAGFAALSTAAYRIADAMLEARKR